MDNPMRGIWIALILAFIVSIVGILVVQYYNGETATVDGTTRYIRNIDDKIRLSRRVLAITYGISFALLLILYFASPLVASYFMFTGPVSVFVFIGALAWHDFSVNMRYSQLKKANWVFDYHRTPTVKTVSPKINVGISMFNDKNQFIASETLESFAVEDMFDQLPPGTKLKGSAVRKPDYRQIKFAETFFYSGIHSPKKLYLRKENNQDIILYNKYMKILHDYAGLFEIEEGFEKGTKALIAFNNQQVDKYVEDNEYIKQFASTKDVELAYISILLNPDLAKLSVKKLLNRFGKVVTDYYLKQENGKLLVSDPLNAPEEKYIDMSYMQQYMSLVIEEYYCQAPEPEPLDDSEIKTHNFYSFKEKMQHASVRKKTEQNTKTLYRLNIKGVIMYVFLEDIKQVSELDEMIVDKFINQRISDMLKTHDH